MNQYAKHVALSLLLVSCFDDTANTHPTGGGGGGPGGTRDDGATGSGDASDGGSDGGTRDPGSSGGSGGGGDGGSTGASGGTGGGGMTGSGATSSSSSSSSSSGGGTETGGDGGGGTATCGEACEQTSDCVAGQACLSTEEGKQCMASRCEDCLGEQQVCYWDELSCDFQGCGNCTQPCVQHEDCDDPGTLCLLNLENEWMCLANQCKSCFMAVLPCTQNNVGCVFKSCTP